MKSFKQLISEGRDAPLYHSVRFSGYIIKILQDKVLIPSTAHPFFEYKLKRKKDPNHPAYDNPYTRGISTTRSLEYAQKWGEYLIFELDQSKLVNNYRIVPWSYWASEPHESNKTRPSFTESEEFIVTDKPLNLTRYATKIMISKRTLRYHWIGSLPDEQVNTFRPLSTFDYDKAAKHLSDHFGGIPVEIIK